MSVVSLENGSDNLCVDCEVRLLKLNRHRSVSVVSLKNHSELQSIPLLVIILVNYSRKENISMGL